MAGPRTDFLAVLDEAIAAMCREGFNPHLADHYADRLKAATRRTFKPMDAMKARFSDRMTAVYRRVLPQRKAKGGASLLVLSRMQPKLLALRDARLMESLRLVEKNRAQTLESVADSFRGWASSLPPQGTRPELARDSRNAIKREALNALDFKTRRVLIDQSHKLRSNIDDAIAIDGGAIAQRWHSNWRQAGYKYRREHKERDEKIYLIRDSWALKAGLIKPDPRLEAGEQYSDQITRPGEEVFCFPGSTRVPFANGVEVAYRRRYCGQLTEIVTETGKTLQATPNHPVLTPKGWAAIDAINEGDYTFEIAEQAVYADPFLECDDHQAEPRIADIFSALEKCGVAEVRSGKTNDFHGDGTDAEIDIVRADRPLLIDSNAPSSKRIGDLQLPRTDDFGAAGCAFRLFLDRSTRAASSLMRSTRAIAMLFRRLVLGDDNVRLSLAAQLATGFEYPLVDCPTTDAVSLGQGEDAFPSLVFGAQTARKSRIIKVRRVAFDGHVFNLQTSTGNYIAGGIVVHNCRCYCQNLYALRDLPDDMLTEKGRGELARVRAR